MLAVGDIDGLGYLGLTGSVAAWSELAGIIGLQTVPADADRSVRFRVDDRAWRIAVDEGEPGLGYVGWQAASREALGRIRDRLTGAGVAVKTDPELAAERNVLEIFVCEDPAGNRVEFFCGAEIASAPFVSPSGARFVTSTGGQSLGLGHVVMFVDDLAATNEFYMKLLDFELTDAIIHGPMGATFAHTNPRHHSLAFGPAMGPMKAGIDHFMLEVDDLDAVGVALDRLMAVGTPLTVTLGKHSNDHMTSFYVRTPSGFDLEYGWGGRLIDEAWVPGWFRSPSIWGHKRVPVPAPAVPAVP